MRPIVFLWLAWALIMCLYQVWVVARLQPQRPDTALIWSAGSTAPAPQPVGLASTLLDPHNSWDSRFYISIALRGYHDPTMMVVSPTYAQDQQMAIRAEQPGWTAVSYAFLPFYPLLMRVLISPLTLFGSDPPTNAAIAAGVVVSLAGTLLAMIALYDLARAELGKPGAMRAAFYLLIFPTGMFLAQVYTDALFLGLTFGSLALARRDKWLFAALFAACATWTRPPGVLLILPLALYWWQQGGTLSLRQRLTAPLIYKGLLAGAPLLAFLIWYVQFGAAFNFIRNEFFYNKLFSFDTLGPIWSSEIGWMLNNNPPALAFGLANFATIIFSVVASIMALLKWRSDRAVVIYSLAVLFFSLTVGSSASENRYAMAAPVIFLMAARWGRSETFDRAWTLGNVLLMGIFAATFSYNMWAG